MGKYLVMMCEEYGEYLDKTPYCITDDWRKDYPRGMEFEVYEIDEDNGRFRQKIDTDLKVESGMIFGYYTDIEEDDPIFHEIKKFPDRTRNKKCPPDILKKIKQLEDYDDELNNCGYISGLDCEKDIAYIYGEYYNGSLPSPW